MTRSSFHPTEYTDRASASAAFLDALSALDETFGDFPTLESTPDASLVDPLLAQWSASPLGELPSASGSRNLDA